ncbi:hypothetical protein HNP48_004758 [Acidovorax soli]|uniref:Uncharacterized protein n=1 Tax=Acidovorax soli TaxID=592050 RepID=A0A7X0UBK1_9BURK|nr:hypothetical protein [Acidovorax soli]MBB6562049.1 hypothetical protein [Acidovorax soli]
MARTPAPSLARHLLPATAVLVLCVGIAHAADVPPDILELRTRCVAGTAGIDLVFELRNRSERTVWVSADTAPWTPSSRSLRITAERQGANAQRLQGPVVATAPTPSGSARVPPSGHADGMVPLSRLFPELAQAAQQAPVRIHWTWQGLVSDSGTAGAWGVTGRFEGEATVQGGGCSMVNARRV